VHTRLYSISVSTSSAPDYDSRRISSLREMKPRERESGVDVETPRRDFLRMLGEARILVSPVADATSIVRPNL